MVVNFGDGRTGAGATASVTYPSGGTYMVTLTVTDNRGATASTSSPVTVIGSPGGLYAADTFSRAVTNGWGTAELGGTWTLSGGATNFSVAGGAGRLSMVPGSTTSATLNAVQQGSIEIATMLSFDKAQTGGGTYISVIGRRVSASVAYQLKIRVQPNGIVTPQIVRVVNGAETIIQSGPTVPGVSWTQGKKVRVRLRVSGTAPTALAARIWEDGAPEPTAWNVVANDSTPSLQANGGLGISTYLSSSATQSPMTISVDELVAGPLPGTPPPPNVAPVASFTSSCAGLTCDFDGSASSDSDGTIVSYGWTFGDGQTGTGRTTSHTYAAASTYTVVLTATDNQGATGSSTGTVTVAPPPPATLYAADSFARTISGGWGTADVGGAWSSASPASLSVGGGMGNITMAPPGSGPSVFLTGVSSTNTDLTIAVRTDKPATGGGIYLSVAGRRVPGAGDYRAKIRLQSNAQVSIQLVRVAANGTETALSPLTTVAGLAYDPTIGLRIRVQATDTSPTTLRARVWSGLGRGAQHVAGDRDRLNCRAPGRWRSGIDELLVEQRDERTRGGAIRRPVCGARALSSSSRRDLKHLAWVPVNAPKAIGDVRGYPARRTRGRATPRGARRPSRSWVRCAGRACLRDELGELSLGVALAAVGGSARVALLGGDGVDTEKHRELPGVAALAHRTPSRGLCQAPVPARRGPGSCLTG